MSHDVFSYFMRLAPKPFVRLLLLLQKFHNSDSSLYPPIKMIAHTIISNVHVQVAFWPCHLFRNFPLVIKIPIDEMIGVTVHPKGWCCATTRMFLFAFFRRSTYLRACSGHLSNTKITKAVWILSREVLWVSFPCSMRLAPSMLQSESRYLLLFGYLFILIDATISTSCMFFVGNSSESGLWTKGI